MNIVLVQPFYPIRSVKKFLWDHPEIIPLAGRKKEIMDSLLHQSQKGVVPSQAIIEIFGQDYVGLFFFECANNADHKIFFHYDVVLGLGDHWLILLGKSEQAMVFPFKLELKNK
jgi:hypothetical protein